MNPNMVIFHLIVSGLTLGSVYGLLALGFHIIFLPTKVLHLAYGPVVVLGGLIAVTLMTVFHLGFAPALCVMTVGGFVAGIAFYVVVISPFGNRPPGTITTSLIAASLVIENLYVFLWGRDPLPLPLSSGSESLMVAGMPIPQQLVWTIGLAICMSVLVIIFLYRTSLGKAFYAVADDPYAAELVGVNCSRIYRYAFGLGSAVAMMTGVVASPIMFAGGTIAGPLTFKAFAAAVVGGLSRPFAVIAGGFVLGMMETVVAVFVTSGYRDVFTMIVMVLVLLFRPRGLFGTGPYTTM